MTVREWFDKRWAEAGAGVKITPGEAWDAATTAERERAISEAVAEVWDALAAEEKAVSKGCAPYSGSFRAANLAERIAARIREGTT